MLAMTMAVAMVLSYIESQIPAFVAVPGVKVGLANIAVIFALYRFGFKEACLVSVVRVLVMSMLFGLGAIFYSMAGAVLSLLGMVILKKTGIFSEISVSVAGGVLHNLGQIIAACIILETNAVKYYLPFLILSGVLAGAVIGTAAGFLVRRIKID
ncbi:MAG: Gx transporter family protein [Oscillospiraceae bacterium]|nr:Gx transporter family protein [Oscillospiraceae bacterium]